MEAQQQKTMMKPLGIVSAGVLLLLFGAVASTHAQQDHPQQDTKHPKQEHQAKPQKAKSRVTDAQSTKQPVAKSQHVVHTTSRTQATRQPERPTPQVLARSRPHPQQKPERPQQVNRALPQVQHSRAVEQRTAWQKHRAQNWQSEHRNWGQRGGYRGYRIPDSRYRGYFGPAHAFRIYRHPVVVVGGYPRFQYDGFWFSLVDPWPQYWSANWYENDDVYIEYSGDGYYLYDGRYPRDRIAISVYVN